MACLASPPLFLTARTRRCRSGRFYRPPERRVRTPGRDSVGIGINFLARLIDQKQSIRAELAHCADIGPSSL